MEDLKSKFLSLHRVYLESDNWIMAAFYGDPDVLRINRVLYERWSTANRSGEPIDYASKKELQFLIKKAYRYASINPNVVRSEWMFRGRLPRIGGSNAFLRLLKRLFLGGK